MIWPVLAMAHHRLGHTADAQQWLDKANQEWRRLSPLPRSPGERTIIPSASEALLKSWHDWIVFELLLSEANALILGQRGEADCFDLLHRAYLHTRLGESRKAEEEFQAAVRGRARDAKVWLARGRVYLLLGDKAHAKADFARGFELKPDDPELWKERGWAYFALGQADKAALAFAEALERLPTDGEDMRREIFAELDRADNLVSKVAALRPEDTKLAAFLRARKANARDSRPAGTVVAGNLLTNGSFEEGPDPGGHKTYQAGSTQLPGWTLSRNSVDVSGSWFLASHGSRCLDLDGDQPGGIQQTVPTKVGQIYRIRFDLAGNPAYWEVLPVIKKLRVKAAGQSADFTFDATGRSIRALGWVGKQWEFTADASHTTVEFLSLDKEGGVGPLVDNISLVPVDEEDKKK
jgi:choice-of-anchor C domain-containing protein